MSEKDRLQWLRLRADSFTHAKSRFRAHWSAVSYALRTARSFIAYSILSCHGVNLLISGNIAWNFTSNRRARKVPPSATAQSSQGI